MAISTDHAPPLPLAAAAKERPARELAVDLLFGPLSRALVPALHRLRVPPPALVLVHGAVGLGAALALGRGALVLAALLLQLRTLLDNADGLLARASGRVSLLGRYLDTEVDLVVNAAVFAALGYATGSYWLALAAFCAATLLLGVGFNVSEAHRVAHGRRTELPAPAGGRTERVLEGLYRLVYGPQDRMLRALDGRRLERALDGTSDSERRRRATLAYHDPLALAFLANTGLSTQSVVLGVCLVAGVPTAYLWLAVACALSLPLLQLRRERRARRALDGAA